MPVRKKDSTYTPELLNDLPSQLDVMKERLLGEHIEENRTKFKDLAQTIDNKHRALVYALKELEKRMQDQMTQRVKELEYQLAALNQEKISKINLINELFNQAVEGIFIIHNPTDSVLASYLKNDAVKQEILVGILTALKNFERPTESKDSIAIKTMDYEGYTIISLSYHQYYGVVFAKGIVHKSFQSMLAGQMIHFSELHLKDINDPVNDSEYQDLSDRLKWHFRGDWA